MKYGIFVLCLMLSAAAFAADFQRGMELKNAGKHNQAAQVFEEIVRANPNDADALEQLATLQGWLGKYSESVQTWLRALTLHPGNTDYQLGLSRVLYWR